MIVKLVAGLGNPGSKYEKTRHNIGFRVLHELAREKAAAFISEKKFQSEVGAFDQGDTRIILAKPQTFMNESGKAVSAIANFFKIKPEYILLVHDEIDLPLGAIRLSTGGSAGHRGVESIAETIGEDIARLRVGIENRKEYRIPATEDYVLQNFNAEEEAKLNEKIIPGALEHIHKFLISN